MFSFQGRRRRLPYFGIGLLSSLLTLPIYLFSEAAESGSAEDASILGIVGLVLLIPALWIGLANGVRRLHDLGASGWLVLLLLIPIVNFIAGIWMLFAPGQSTENKYGEPPT